MVGSIGNNSYSSSWLVAMSSFSAFLPFSLQSTLAESSQDPQSVFESEKLGSLGNAFAQNKDYNAAIKCFTDAIRQNQYEYRFYGNRSFCYQETHQYQLALEDADTALRIQPGWLKGLFRKGKALFGLGRYIEADAVLTEVLKRDTSCKDTIAAVIRVRAKRLVSQLSIDYAMAERLILVHGSFGEAAQAYTGRDVDNGGGDDLDDTQHNEFVEAPPPSSSTPAARPPSRRSSASLSSTAPSSAATPPLARPIAPQSYAAIAATAEPDNKAPSQPRKTSGSVPLQRQNKAPTATVPVNNADPFMNPSNPYNSCTLWIGNLNGKVNEKSILNLFKEYAGENSIKSHALMLEKHCAFVNFHTSQQASAAMRGLQGYDFNGMSLLIRFPDRAGGTGGTVLRKPISPNNDQNMPHPLPDGQCKYYRLGSCRYGTTCKYKHAEKTK